MVEQRGLPISDARQKASSAPPLETAVPPEIATDTLLERIFAGRSAYQALARVNLASWPEPDQQSEAVTQILERSVALAEPATYESAVLQGIPFEIAIDAINIGLAAREQLISRLVKQHAEQIAVKNQDETQVYRDKLLEAATTTIARFTQDSETSLDTIFASTFKLLTRTEHEEQTAIGAYKGLVVTVVRDLNLGIASRAVFSLEDAMQEGQIGLLVASRNHDPYEGPFLNYAKLRIRGTIIDAMRRISLGQRNLATPKKKVSTFEDEFILKMEREPSIVEVTAGTGIAENVVLAARELMHLQTISLDMISTTVDEDTDHFRSQIEFQVTDKNPTPEEIVVDSITKRELTNFLSKALVYLDEHERQIIELYYENKFSMEEIAGIIGLSPSRISQLHAKALRDMRRIWEKGRELQPEEGAITLKDLMAKMGITMRTYKNRGLSRGLTLWESHKKTQNNVVQTTFASPAQQEVIMERWQAIISAPDYGRRKKPQPT